MEEKGKIFFRCVYFIPNVISVAVIAYLWKFIYNPDFGLLNNIIKAFGGKGDINWFGTDTAIWSVLIVLIWHGFGWGMLIYYTGIKNIDPTLYEAAAIDGASQTQTFLRITLPLMKPVIQVNVTMAVISALKQFVFELFYIYSLPFSFNCIVILLSAICYISKSTNSLKCYNTYTTFQFPYSQEVVENNILLPYLGLPIK